MSFERIGIVGAGAWGVALANVIARAGRTVTVVARDQASAAAIAANRESPHLAGVRLDERVGIVGGGRAADHDAILVAVPSQHLRAATTALGPALTRDIPVVACAKGIERGTRKFMTEV